MKEKQSFHPKERNLKPNPNAGSGGVGASGTAGHSHMSGGTAGQRSGASAHGHRSGASSAAISIDSSLSSTHQAGATTPTRTSPSLPSSPTLSNQGNNNGNSNANNGHHSNRKKNLYKTELCRSAEETGECPYGPKCQFAHSLAELRTIDRHPRYKTEMCKTFWDHGTCPYGRRCCFLHSKKEVEEAKAAAAQLNQSGTTINVNGNGKNSAKASLKNLSIKSSNGEGGSNNSIPFSSSNITLHSPRARTVTVQGFEAPSSGGGGGGDKKKTLGGTSPILSKLDIGTSVHARTSSVPLEIHTREIQSARPVLGGGGAPSLSNNSFRNHHHGAFGGSSLTTTPTRSSFWGDSSMAASGSRDDLDMMNNPALSTFASSSPYDRQPFSAGGGGLEMKKSWDALPFMKAPLSSNNANQPSNLSIPFSPSSRAAAAAAAASSSSVTSDHPWLSSPVVDPATSSVWPSSPKQASVNMHINTTTLSSSNTPQSASSTTAHHHVETLGSALGKLSVATNFTNDFRTRNIGSLSAIPFKERVGSFPGTTPVDKQGPGGLFGMTSSSSSSNVLKSSMSAFPDSVAAQTGFFPESPVASSGRMILTESLNGGSVDRAGGSVYGSSLRSVSGMGGLGGMVGSPLATSFGEDRPFGASSFSSSANEQGRKGLRDVWAVSAANVEVVLEEASSSTLVKTSPPLSEAGVEEDIVKGNHVGVRNQSMVSPPVTPLRKTNLS